MDCKTAQTFVPGLVKQKCCCTERSWEIYWLLPKFIAQFYPLTSLSLLLGKIRRGGITSTMNTITNPANVMMCLEWPCHFSIPIVYIEHLLEVHSMYIVYIECWKAECDWLTLTNSFSQHSDLFFFLKSFSGCQYWKLYSTTIQLQRKKKKKKIN